jgi:hypothetical protein
MSPGHSKEPVHFQNVYEGFVISGICLVKVVSIVPSSGVTTFMLLHTQYNVLSIFGGCYPIHVRSHYVINYILYVMPLRNVYQNVLLDSGTSSFASLHLVNVFHSCCPEKCCSAS